MTAVSLAPGQTLLHYRLIELVGEGGMGQVWKAHDSTLDRYVALKALPDTLTNDPNRLRWFEREARVLAALSHPNIAVIHGLHQANGVRFLAMEFVGGEDLSERLRRGPLPPVAALKLGVQVASAMEAAHQRGIVHRDLKPANIRFSADGSVKVLDFGLAKMPAIGPSQDSATTAGPPHSQPTAVGWVLGTPGYMSPEQAAGLSVDSRCDIWAFGCVLYEALTCRQAFPPARSGDSAADWTVLPTSTPAPVRALLRHCLTPDIGRRLADIRIAREALEASLTARPAGGPASTARAAASVAVLPFDNMSPDPENQFFSDGLAEDLINALTRLPAVHVASRTSSFRFRGKDLDVRQIGDELNVAAIVEGSVRRAGNRVRVTAQLLSVADGYHLWSERYDREMADVFAIQDDIVASIVKALAPALLGTAAQPVQRPTENLEAYELYLRGRHYWHQRSPATVHTAIQCFEQAIAIDPAFALAYAGLADCHALLRVYGWVPASASRPAACEAVTRATTLAPMLAEVQYSLAFFTFCFEPAWRQAETHFKEAIAINPRSSLAVVYYGIFLAARYRFDEAVVQVNHARELDPLSPFVNGVAALTLYVTGRFEPAELAARRAVQLQPDYLFGLWVLGLALCALERHAEGIEVLERVVASSRAPIFLGVLGLGYGLASRADKARQLLQELEERRSRGEYVIPLARLTVYLGLGDVAGIRSALAACLADETPPQPLRTVCASFLDRFRGDPEIDGMLDAMYDGARPE